MKKVCFLLGLFPVLACAEVCEKVDDALSTSYQKMQKFGSYGGNYDDQVLEKVTQQFQSALELLASPDVFDCAFPKSQDSHLKVLRSPDKKLLAFSWDWQTGGTMHFEHHLILHKKSDGSVGKYESDSRLRKLLQAELNGKIYYWIVEKWVGDGRNHSQRGTLYQIKNDKFEPAELIKTSKIRSDIGFSYDPHTAKTYPEFEYDDKHKTFHFPLVIQKEALGSGTINDKYIQYRFDGNYFVREKN